ncbi:DNA-processing protein DprA [Candidatus Poriferisodalis sp.]|uniref:DNA-processing protein DprA n=1 Tax=Candidatus Poriferisodalis sp. TaxID=3101277 RepID=UPI003B023DF9
MNAGGAADDERAELGALVELCSLPHMGPARLRAVLNGRDALEAIDELRAGRAALLNALRACRGVDDSLIATWRRQAASAFDQSATSGHPPGAGLLDAHARAGIWLLVPIRSDAAEAWKTDPEPPALLFGQGAAIDLAVRRVGVVGTRRCTAYGRTVARQLGAGLAAAGVAVVSGLATGIDGIAQRAALEEGGPVIGVVGSGLDQVYPAANRSLWGDVAQHGTLLSEYPLGRRAAPWQFPARNRIVAALCEVLVVVESGPQGGSMYTVDAAAERDRPVMAVPGAITSAASAGTNRLLAEGCAPVCDVDDILTALGEPAGAQAVAAGPAAPVHPLDRQILDELTAAPRTLDELALRSGAPLGELASALGRLQLSGWVSETGGWWERAR